jgi:hypothetical protein
MEVGNKVVVSLALTEKHFGIVFGVVLNALFFLTAAYVVQATQMKEMIKTEESQEVMHLELSKYENRLSIKTYRPVSAPDSRLKQNKGELASLDSLLAMVKNNKPTEQKVAVKKDLGALTQNIGDATKMDKMMKDVKLTDDLIQELNKGHQEKEGLSDKILNKAKMIMANNISYFKMCYDKVLLSDSSIDGALPTTFHLDGSGRVNRIAFSGAINGKASGKDLNECFLNVGKRMAFPKEIAGQSLKYTFNLQR